MTDDTKALVERLRDPGGVYGYQSQLACQAADAIVELEALLGESEAQHRRIFEAECEQITRPYRATIEQLERELAEARMLRSKDQRYAAYDALVAINERLDRELAETRKDAERYRWLRQCMWWRTDPFAQDIGNMQTGHWQSKLFKDVADGPRNLDATIDAAMKGASDE